MKKRTNFTTDLLRRFEAEGRGDGIYEDFSAWHQVRRGEPGSRGLSSLFPSTDAAQQSHQLSAGESLTLGLSHMLRDIDDFRMQAALSLGLHAGNITAYGERAARSAYPGTRAIAKQLKVRHPMIGGKGDRRPWRMSTDAVATLRAKHKRTLLALSWKDKPWKCLSRRTRELLSIEREYWLCQNAEWLLLTPELMTEEMIVAVTRAAGWVFGLAPERESALLEASTFVLSLRCQVTYSQCFSLICKHFNCDVTRSQALFWQAVCKGFLPISWRSSLWVTNQIEFVDIVDFRSANPVLSRRSAWEL